MAPNEEPFGYAFVLGYDSYSCTMGMVREMHEAPAYMNRIGDKRTLSWRRPRLRCPLCCLRAPKSIAYAIERQPRPDPSKRI